MEDRALDISLVICTYDRPARVARLLPLLARQQTSFRFEIVVVDNHPGSGVPVRQDGVRWLEEPRRGLSYARNTGIRAAHAPAIAFIDDDIEPPETWMEALVSPLLREGYDVVTGPTEPLKLETEAERMFEAYGGHGHVGIRRVYDSAWLASLWLKLPLWEAGGLGNCAIRKSAFERAGFFEEALGPGTPASSWEDLHLIYRMLRSGCRILHEPAARVRHAHREGLPDLTRQLCGYRRGEVCFCLLILQRHDWRALTHLLLWVPFLRTALFTRELWRRIRGTRLLNFGIMARELAAYASGPAALAASLRRKRELARTATAEQSVR